MLRDPKDVAKDARATMSVLFDRKYGGEEIDRSVDIGTAIEDAIRARDREVIAEAKRAVAELAKRFPYDVPGTDHWISYACSIAALDAILNEESE